MKSCAVKQAVLSRLRKIQGRGEKFLFNGKHCFDKSCRTCRGQKVACHGFYGADGTSLISKACIVPQGCHGVQLNVISHSRGRTVALNELYIAG